MQYYKAGDIIFKQGESPDNFYLIIEGKVNVFTNRDEVPYLFLNPKN